MTPEEVDCLSSYLKALETDTDRVEPQTELVATWLLSAVHAIKNGVWEASPIFSFKEAPSTGDIPLRFHINSSPETMSRCARKFISLQWKTTSPLFEDAAGIVQDLEQRWPTSFRKWLSHELLRLSEEIQNIPHPPFELPKDAELEAQFAEKKASYLAELAALERFECERMEAGELIAGSEQLPERGTHLYRFWELVQEKGTLGAKGRYLRFKFRVRNDFADFVAAVLTLHGRGRSISLGSSSQNAVQSAESNERLLRAIFGEGSR